MPIIVHEKLDEKTAGYINMNPDITFFITMDLNKFYLSEQRLCILSHEICHKFMYVNHFRDTGLKNEYLTDACAIYVGFGQMMLKGCQTISVTHQDDKKITQTNNIGYLEKWQLSYLYYIKNPLTFPQKVKKSLNQIWKSSINYITESESGFYIFWIIAICLIGFIIAFFIGGFEAALTTFFIILILSVTGWIREL